MVPRWISVRLDGPSTWHHTWTCERRDDKDDKKKYVSTATGRGGEVPWSLPPLRRDILMSQMAWTLSEEV
jgi:hypothetical protein